MEMYEKSNLMDLIRRTNASFSLYETSTYMEGLIKGIRFLEENKIMHRDIKPENILIHKKTVFEEIQLVIGDFGLASYT